MSSPRSERKRYHKDNAPTDDILTLINLVRQNPALYNYKLQPNQRRRSDILSGWQEVARQIGNKYTVQEVRRKWKNLRDTYHQYRLRTPKCIEGRLSKWRYAKELEFLSKVYQPKLKSQRNQSYGTRINPAQLPIGAVLQLQMRPQVDDDDDDLVDDEENSDTTLSHHTATQIALVNDETEAETFILTTYEEGVGDDVVTVTHHSHHQHTQANSHHHQQSHQQQHHSHHHQSQHDGSISSIELSHIAPDDVVDDVDDDEDDVVVQDGHDMVVDIVKHELEEDGATGAEVDYEEVCLYEEATGAHTNIECEIGVSDGVDGSSDVVDSKAFQYIDAHDFCIEDIEPQTETNVRSAPEHHFTTTTSNNSNVTSANTSNPGGGVSNSTSSSSIVSNSVLASGTVVSDAKLKNLTLVTTTTNVTHTHQPQIALVDVTEATSTSITISTTAAASLTAPNVATVSTTVASALCNNTLNAVNAVSAAPTSAILQLPQAPQQSQQQQHQQQHQSQPTPSSLTSTSTSTSFSPCTQLSTVSAAASSTLVKEEQQQLQQRQQQQHQQQQQLQTNTLAKRDELDLFFDFLKKKMQCFSKPQITQIQMEFLNCVMQQETAEQDLKD